MTCMFRSPTRVTGWSLTAVASALALAGLVSLALLSSGAAAAGTSGSQMRTIRLHAVPAAAARISVRRTRVGAILVGSNGRTLYAFSRDGRNRDRCAMIRGCTGVWPLVTTSGRPRAGSGVRGSMLGTIRVGRAHQATYAGHPLYTYTGDTGPGQTEYVGVSQFGGTWPAVRGSGALVK
jgi:predicted lipoprotein with Yx(FWY)xxD motif